MASVMNLEAIQSIMSGSIDFVNDDLRVGLLRVGSSAEADADTENIVYVSNIVTLNESDDTTYNTGSPPAGRVALATQSLTIDDPNDRVEFDESNVSASFTLAGDAGSDYIGIFLYKHVGADTANPYIAYIDFSSNVTASATQIDVTWNGEGIIQGRTAP